MITAEDPSTAAPRARPARRRGVRRLLLGVTVTAALAAGVVIGPSVLGGGHGTATSYASSEIEIEREGEEYLARIKDPYADHEKYHQAFLALGLDVDVRIVPVAPTKVGQEVTGIEGGVRASGKSWTSASGMEDREGKPCSAQQKNCYLVLRVPADLTGKASLRLGRQAKPGERYDEGGQQAATSKAGVLAGYRVDEKTVREVLPEITKRGLKITYLIIEPYPGNPGGFTEVSEQSTPVGKDWVVWEAEQVASDTVRLLVTDKRYDKNPVYGGPRDNVVTD
ncbi:hypothetical protein [Nonomuraea sediminis]|uniref:hypothetical protein n=1 Tax=Nonomuraea sediminis TaxID=2835864 RepID=UPI001BDC874F|nr:hypothetical protein [Nonomuraea sediminis]